MLFWKKLFTLVILPLTSIAIVSTVVLNVNDDYHKSRMTKIHHNDKTIIANKTKKYVDYALSKGKTTIDKATIQTNLNNGNYTTTGFLDNKSVSVNTSTKPVIENGKATVYSLSPKDSQCVTSVTAVHKSAKENAKLDRQLDTFENDTDVAIDTFLVQLIAGLIIATVGTFWFANLIMQWPSHRKSE